MSALVTKDLWTYLSTNAVVLLLFPPYDGKPSVFTTVPEDTDSYLYIGSPFASSPSDCKNDNVSSFEEWRDISIVTPRTRDRQPHELVSEAVRGVLHRASIPPSGVRVIEMIEASDIISDDTEESFVCTIELRMIVR